MASVVLGSFNILSTDVVGTTYDVSFGAGFNFKFCILFSSLAGLDTQSARHLREATGFATSSTNRCCFAYGSGTAAASAALSVRQSEAAVILDSNTATAGALDVDVEANWPANSIRFIVDEVFTSATTVFVFMVGGTDITNQKVGKFQEPAAIGVQSVTDPGFQPTGMLFGSVAFATVPPSQSAAQGCYSFGAFDGTRQWVQYIGGDDANTTMDNVSYMRSGECIAMGPEPAITLNARASCTSFHATGVNVDWLARASTRYVFYLAWAGGSFRVDNLLTQIDLNNFSKSGFGFQPFGTLFASCCRAESAVNTPTPHSQLSVGMAVTATNRFAEGEQDEDAVGTSTTVAWSESDQIYKSVDDLTQALTGLMDFVSNDADGFTVVMDDADPAQNFVGFASWGPPAAVPKSFLLSRNPIRSHLAR